MSELKRATHRRQDGTTETVTYDPDYPCWMCGEPVVEASTSGTVVCPWCDCGMTRENPSRQWNFKEARAAFDRFRNSEELAKMLSTVEDRRKQG